MRRFQPPCWTRQQYVSEAGLREDPGNYFEVTFRWILFLDTFHSLVIVIVVIPQTRNSELVIYVLVQFTKYKSKQLSMPHLSNKRSVFEVTKMERAGYAQVNIFNLRLYLLLGVREMGNKTTHTKILNVHFY